MFTWADPAVDWGYEKRLDEDQLWDLAGQDTLETCTDDLLTAWQVSHFLASLWLPVVCSHVCSFPLTFCPLDLPQDETKGMRIQDMLASKTAKGEGLVHTIPLCLWNLGLF